jgi:hypothetical protein
VKASGDSVWIGNHPALNLLDGFRAILPMTRGMAAGISAISHTRIRLFHVRQLNCCAEKVRQTGYSFRSSAIQGNNFMQYERKRGNKMESRDYKLASLWAAHGCPERMKIHIISTGEEILLFNGLPVIDNAENNPLLMRFLTKGKRGVATTLPVTDNCTCVFCLKQFYSKRGDAKYCSPRCRKKAERNIRELEKIKERESLLAGNPAAGSSIMRTLRNSCAL